MFRSQRAQSQLERFAYRGLAVGVARFFDCQIGLRLEYADQQLRFLRDDL
jgi:hypothetical protein